MIECYLEDVKTGDRFGSPAFVITKADMLRFAAEFDPQSFHLDVEAAAASDFGGLTASGWHTAAIGMRLFMTGDLRFVGGAIGLGVDELRWPTAVQAGDELRLETEIVETRVSRSKPNRGIVRVRNVMTNQRGEVVLSLLANALVQRRPSD